MTHALLRPFCLLALSLPALAFAQTSTLDKIKQSGSMTLAYRESSIPFSYLGGDAQPTGFGFEICEKIADRVKAATGRSDLKKQYQAVTSANRIPLLQNGTIDIECGSTTNNSERAKQVAFATNYFYTGTRFLVKTGTNVNKLADLAGKPVVSTTGTTNFQIIRRLNEDQQARHRPARREGPRRIGADGADRPRRRLRHGRHPALRPARQLAEPGRALGRRRADPGRAVRDHGQEGRPGVQEAGRRHARGDDEERRVRSALQEVVPVADPAEGDQPQRADEQGAASTT